MRNTTKELSNLWGKFSLMEEESVEVQIQALDTLVEGTIMSGRQTPC
jgi:hypothetical protein